MLGGLHVIFCRPPADTGSYTIPAAVMATLPDTSTQGFVFVWRLGTATVAADPYTILLAAGHGHASGFTPITD